MRKLTILTVVASGILASAIQPWAKRETFQIAQAEEQTNPTAQNIREMDAFFYAATDVINEYKDLTVNYLADNESVSSVPRNFAAIQKRHLAWMDEFEALARGSKPDFTSIRNADNYRNVQTGIQKFRTTIPNDAGLSATELQFLSDVKAVQMSCLAIKQRLKDLIGSSSYRESVAHFAGDEGKQLGRHIEDAIAALSEHVDEINKSRNLTTAFQSKRVYLRDAVAATWERQADDALRTQNHSDAETLIEQIKNTLNGPEVFAQVAYELDRSRKLADTASDVYYAPYLSRRAVLAYQNAIATWKERLPSIPLEASMRQAIETQIATAEKYAKNSYADAVEALGDKDSWAKARAKSAQHYLKFNSKTATKECLILGNDVAQGSNGSVESEEKFALLVRECKA